MSKILVDGDGCPVVEETIAVAQAFGIRVVLIADTSHDLLFEGAETMIADKGKDRTDFILLQNVEKNDIVVTQDYGLAALVLSRGAYPVSQNGLLYTNENIEGLLAKRHMGTILRKHKKYRTTIKKRTHEDDKNFQDGLYTLLLDVLSK